MHEGMVQVLLTVLVIILLAVIFFPLGQRFGTPPGVSPPKGRTRGATVALIVGLLISCAAIVWMAWAIHHHHGALGVLVLAGLFFGSNVLLFGIRFHRHRQRRLTPGGDDEADLPS
jgi:hypothetical protein